MSRSKLLLDTWLVTTLLALFNIIIALIVHGYSASSFNFYTVAIPCILEFGILLIIGACLMSRQPLDDDKRYDEEGNPTKSWEYALLGQKAFLMSFLMLPYIGLFYVFGILFAP